MNMKNEYKNLQLAALVVDMLCSHMSVFCFLPENKTRTNH